MLISQRWQIWPGPFRPDRILGEVEVSKNERKPNRLESAQTNLHWKGISDRLGLWICDIVSFQDRLTNHILAESLPASTHPTIWRLYTYEWERFYRNKEYTRIVDLSCDSWLLLQYTINTTRAELIVVYK